MFDSLFWAFVGLALLVTISLGADTVLTIRNTLTGGTRDGIWTVAGIISGFFFQPLLAAFGVAALFVKLPVAIRGGEIRRCVVSYLPQCPKFARSGPTLAGPRHERFCICSSYSR